MRICDCEQRPGRECECLAGYDELSVCRLNELLDYATNYRTVNSRTAAIPEQAFAIRELEKAIRRAKKRAA